MGATSKTGLDREQRRRLDERGLVRLGGLIAPDAAEAMAERLWGELARRHAIQRHDAATWRAERPAQLGAFQRTGAFNVMGTGDLRAILDDLVGEGAWQEPRGWGLPLVCFPTGQTAWTLPHQVWHLDLTPEPRWRGPPPARVFLLLAELRAGGGGTLVAAGSHRAVEEIAGRHGGRMSSQDMRKQLARDHAWFADLMSPAKAADSDRVARFMGKPTLANGVALQVEEIVGAPGDVWLMHPHALHGLSANVLNTPRLALTQTIYPKGWTGP